MTDFSAFVVADTGQPARMITLLSSADFVAWLNRQPPRTRTAAHAARFTAQAGELLIIPGDVTDEWAPVLGVTNAAALTPWCLAPAAERLPEGHYRIDGHPSGAGALGWLLAQHQFTRYKKPEHNTGARVLLTSQVAAIAEHIALAHATALVRDLVNTPAADMGPAALEAEAQKLAKLYDAKVTVTKGDALAHGYPLIHAVGRAAHPQHAPRLIELEWGNPALPRLAVVGKGVTFDSGGLNLKPGGSMRLMKKDMGGAAHALALASLIMGARVNVRLHLLLPVAENAVAGDAFRPGDVLMSRAGISVEIDNTDAEGRLVLADALAKAVADQATTIIDFATLTGAARVALGPDLPALFSDDDTLADALISSSTAADDGLWRLPLWPGYADMLKSDIADTLNSAEGGMAGAITAALFLQKFVPRDLPWAHLDTYSWRGSSKPGRPKGGEALGLRAVFNALKTRYGTLTDGSGYRYDI